MKLNYKFELEKAEKDFKLNCKPIKDTTNCSKTNSSNQIINKKFGEILQISDKSKKKILNFFNNSFTNAVQNMYN